MKLSFKKIEGFLKRFNSRWDRKYRAEGEDEFKLATKAEDIKARENSSFTELELWWRDDPEPFCVAVDIDEQKFIIYKKCFEKNKLAKLEVLRDCSREWQAFNPSSITSD